MTVAGADSGVNMVFIRDTELALRGAAALVNTLPETQSDGGDRLVSRADLRRHLEEHPYTGARLDDDDELEAVRQARHEIYRLWRTTREGAVPIVNGLLREAQALPQLVIHDEYDWHIHATSDDASLASRMVVETAMAFTDVIRADQWQRVRICSADDCASVYVDFSKNGSKRYCDTGNCGNRMNVNAYRRRRAKETA